MAIIEARKRYNVVACGRRFGKSQLALALQAELAGRDYPARCIYTTPTAEDYAKRWNEALITLAQLITSVKTQEGIITLLNRVEVHWFGLHRDTGIRGNKYHRAIIDEAAHAPKLADTWNYVIRPTLTDYKGDAYFLSTPLSGSYFNELMRNKKTDANWSVSQYTTFDNPFIDPTEIEEAKKELPSIAYRQEYLAEDVQLEGSRIRREWLKYGEVPEGSTFAIGVDLAISQATGADYTAIVVSAKNENTYYICEVVRRQMTFHESYNAIVQLSEKWKPSVINIEAVQYQSAMVQELIRNTMLPVQSVKPTKDKLTRFMPIEGKYEHGHIIHSRQLSQDFEGELLEFPDGAHDDMIDALVYSINAHDAGVVFGWL